MPDWNAPSRFLLLIFLLLVFSLMLNAQPQARHELTAGIGILYFEQELPFQHEYLSDNSVSLQSSGTHLASVTGWTAGLGYAYRLNARWGLRLSANYSQGRQQVLKGDTRRLFDEGQLVDELPLDFPVEYEMGWANLQPYWYVNPNARRQLAIGTGISYLARRMEYRSGFVYRDENQSFHELVFVEEVKSRWGIPLSVLLKTPLSQNLQLGIEGSGNYFFDKSFLLHAGLQLLYVLN